MRQIIIRYIAPGQQAKRATYTFASQIPPDFMAELGEWALGRRELASGRNKTQRINKTVTVNIIVSP